MSDECCVPEVTLAYGLACGLSMSVWNPPCGLPPCCGLTPDWLFAAVIFSASIAAAVPMSSLAIGLSSLPELQEALVDSTQFDKTFISKSLPMSLSVSGEMRVVHLFVELARGVRLVADWIRGITMSGCVIWTV
ncbi:hypothetical protein DEU56DRAFT_794251 [Suillus clintonianus]|uniref:uncharacterized protein n=1 Tax=Suillus clintonianus TaxID=1904413 RepID=UPI001B85F066|nr:uncharacterized protein DEU56DRAFT_794251 [Suillus clintonianus]KAG2142430.1 hypothetical protein DEU56DRAFT_794251 [Suillus clintonianus]